MSYVLGVDGGGSKTLVVLGDELGSVLGVGRGGNANHQRQGLAPAMEHVRLAAAGALRMAGVEPAAIDYAFFGLAGADLPEDFELLRPAVRDLGMSRYTQLDNDIVAVLRSGTDNPNAVVVGWGSGTNAVGINAAGRTVRLPALGWMSGDWGGGWDLGQAAIALVARAYDGRGVPTALTQAILSHLEVENVDQMIRRLYFGPDDDTVVLHLPPIIFDVAETGDPVACDLVRRAGVEIATTALALLRRLDLLQTPADVILGGGIFRASGSLLLDTARTRLQERAPLTTIVRPDVEPVIGAYFVGLEMLGVAVDLEVRRRARESFDALAGSALAGGASR